MTTALSKRELRERWAQLRALMCEWDPIGVMGLPGWPRDEYDCLVGPLMTLLDSRACKEEIAHYLRHEVSEHFGLPPESYDLELVADRLRKWFDRGWRSLAEPVTVFIALLDEGVDVWRPVRARPLGSGLYRIVGVDGDTSTRPGSSPLERS